jgi:DNA-binding NtrC family response regulator
MDAQPSRVVLVVDDEPLIADTLAIILKQNGWHAYSAYSGEQAVTEADRLRPDVVISDVVMGKMNGVELAIHLADQLPDCRVLLISGHAVAAEHLESGARKGFLFPILPKPTHPDEILAFVKHTQ